MQKSEKALKKEIYADCRKAMRIPLSFLIAEQYLTGLLAVYTANILGTFADAVFRADLSYALSNIGILFACIACTVFALPMLGLIGNTYMLKYALVHDRMVLGRFLDKEYSRILTLDAGEIQYRLEEDPCSLRIYWVVIIGKMGMLPVTFAYLLYHTMHISWLFSVIMLGVSAIKLISPIAVKKVNAKYDAEIRAYNTALRAYETEITTKPYIVRLYGLKDAFINHFDRLYRMNFRKTEAKDIACKTFTEHISLFLNTFCTLTILLIGAVMVAKGRITPGAVAAMVGYLAVTNSLLGDAGEVIRDFPIMRNIANRMIVFYSDAEDVSGEKVESPAELSAKGLAFSYGEKEIFTNVSFSVQKGDKAAVCGKNGSGKSTLLKVLCGLLKEYRGSLTFNRKPLSAYAIDEWRRQIAYAEQDPYLFRGSVRDNIRIGNPAAADEQVEAILDTLGIGGLAERQVSMKTDLSGGERQKISLARALLKDTPVLILDEPTNHLDEKSAVWLQEFIRKTEKTVLFVSHRDALSEQANLRIAIG